MDSDTATTIQRLEAHVAHLEHHYDQLNEVVVEQGREIARLRQQLQKTAAMMETLELDRVQSTQQKPPHSVI